MVDIMVAIHSQTFDQIDLKYHIVIISLAWHIEKLFVIDKLLCIMYYIIVISYS